MISVGVMELRVTGSDLKSAVVRAQLGEGTGDWAREREVRRRMGSRVGFIGVVSCQLLAVS